MDKKGIGFLVIALALAGLSAAGMYAYLRGVSEANAAATSEPTFVPVVVAAQDLTFGTKLSSQHLKVSNYPHDSVPKGSYTDADSVLNQTTKVFLVEGEAILGSKLSSVGGGLSVRIPESMRAISLDINEITGVSGFVLPGDRVDILVTVDNAKGPGVAVTKTILQGIEVLAAGPKEDTSSRHVNVQSVTLLVDAGGAETIALASHQGQVHLVLRNPGDNQMRVTGSTDTKSVLGLTKPRSVSTRRRTAPKTVPVEVKDVTESFTIIRDGQISKQSSPTEGE